MFHSIDAAKKAAKRLQKFLSASGQSCKLSTAQELVAAACRYPSWHDLQRLVGTPAEAQDLGDYVAREHLCPRLLSAGINADVDAILATLRPPKVVISRKDLEAFYSRIDTTERFKGIAEDGPTEPFKEQYHVRHPDIAELGDCWVDIEYHAQEETMDGIMPIREVCAELWHDSGLVGFLMGTLYTPFQYLDREEAMVEADVVSDYDVWTVGNIASMRPFAFESGVFFLDWIEIRPNARFQGFGSALLVAALKDIKKRYRTTMLWATDPSRGLTFAPEDASTGLKNATVEHVASLMRRVQSDNQPIGRGGLLLFSNSRQGKQYQTIYAMGGLLTGQSLEDIELQDEAVHRQAWIDSRSSEEQPVSSAVGQMQMTALVRTLGPLAGAFLEREAEAIPEDAYPEHRSPCLWHMNNADVVPPANFMGHMPNVVEQVVVFLKPCDLEMQSPLMRNEVEAVEILFKNGTMLRVEVEDLAYAPFEDAVIREIDRKFPVCPHGSRSYGRMMATIYANLRLLWTTDRELKVPGLSQTITIRRNEISYNGMEWPSEEKFVSELRRRVASASGLMEAKFQSFSRGIMAGGRVLLSEAEQAADGELHVREVGTHEAWPDRFEVCFGTAELSVERKSMTIAQIGVDCSPEQKTLPCGCVVYPRFGDQYEGIVFEHLRGILAQLVSDETSLLDAEWLEAVAKGDLSLLGYADKFWQAWVQIYGGIIDHYSEVPVAEAAMATGSA